MGYRAGQGFKSDLRRREPGSVRRIGSVLGEDGNPEHTGLIRESGRSGAERLQVDTSDGKGLTEERQPLINVRDSACSGFEPFPIVRQVSGAFAGGAPSKELI